MGGTRVLQVAPYYEGAWGYGGIPRVVAVLCAALARRGHRVTVCTTDACDSRTRLSNEGGPGPRLRPWRPRVGRDGVEVRVFPNLSNRLAYDLQLFQPIGLRRWLREHARGFDVAHVHGHHHLPGAIAAGELRRARVPYLVEPNGTAPIRGRRRLAKAAFDRSFGRGVLRGARGVIAVTEAERAQLEALGVEPGRLCVLPNPLDLDEFAGFARPAPRAPAEPRRVLYLGQLLPRKQVDVLVRALAALPGSTELEIAGNDGGCERSLRELVQRLGLGPRVRFAGLLRGRERLQALAAADVVAYAGRDEVFGLVPLEALLCGTPVVVANDSGCGEVIGRVGGGLAVPPGDAAALARAIARVLAEPERWREASRGAAEAIRRLFGADAVAAACEAIYEAATVACDGAPEAGRWTRRPRA
jgi:glycosyltransferase involved in cell wall biosynthesis